MAKITKIDIEHYRGSRRWITFRGVNLELDNGKTVFFGIADNSNCCESWDYLYSSDEVKDFIGAEYLGIEERSTWPSTIDIPEECKSYRNDESWDYLCSSDQVEDFINDEEFDSDCGFQSIDVKTSKGTLQFVVYNIHNGYYSHAVITIDEENQINDEQYL